MKRPQRKLGTIINRGTTLVTGPSSRLSIVSDSEVIFTCRLTSTVSALAVLLTLKHMHPAALAAFAFTVSQRISVRILRGATVLVTVFYSITLPFYR